jgi:hypothetical protein
VVDSSNLHRTLPRINILLKISRLTTAVEAVGMVNLTLTKGLPCTAIPQINLLTTRTNRLVTTQTNHTHNPASKPALIAEVMAATAATTSTVPIAACQVLAQMLRLLDLVDEGVVLRLPNSQTCRGRQRLVLEAAAQPLKCHARNRLSYPKHPPTLHLSMLTITRSAHPRICV